MEWQQHLQERAARYADIARRTGDPRQRVQAKLTAGIYQAALSVCNTTEADVPCCFAPDHWIRKACRRAKTGSCAIAPGGLDLSAETSAPSEINSETPARRVA